MFDAIDVDRNGGLSRAELAAAMRRLGYELLSSELDALMAGFDKYARLHATEAAIVSATRLTSISVAHVEPATIC